MINTCAVLASLLKFLVLCFVSLLMGNFISFKIKKLLLYKQKRKPTSGFLRNCEGIWDKRNVNFLSTNSSFPSLLYSSSCSWNSLMMPRSFSVFSLLKWNFFTSFNDLIARRDLDTGCVTVGIIPSENDIKKGQSFFVDLVHLLS